MRERDNQLRDQLQLRDEYFDVELRKKGQFMEKAIKQRDLEWKGELVERDAMWKEKLRVRDVAFWEESRKQEGDLCRMVETRDRQLQDSLVSRDQAELNSLHSCSESLRLMTQEQINLRATMVSIRKIQCELTKANGEILNWAMTTMLGKKKVPNL